VFESAPTQNWQVKAFQIDWQAPNGTILEAYRETLLDGIVYRTSSRYDGLNRVKMVHYPQDVEGKRRELVPHYNRAGALERVTLDGKPYVEHIAYNAKGQRILIAYGNGIMTRHAYDLQTFRLLRLRTERYTRPVALTYRPSGAPLQDFSYEYDLVGNILRIGDRTPESGIPNSQLGEDALDRAFTYDPIYRLLSATGRECDVPLPLPPWIDEPRCVDRTRTRGYTEQYQYDLAGNMLELQHQVSGSNATHRVMNLVAGNNRLASVTIGQTDYRYTYDANGNLIQENGSRHFEWDYGDRLQVFRNQAGNAEPSVYSQYLYDTAGQRVKKLVRKQGGQIEVTIYIDGMFEYHRTVQGSATQENNTLHVMDDQSRIALVRIGNPFPDDKTPAVKFHLGDHLGSSNVVVDDLGALVNREEYTPYGETSFGSFAKKRYRFTGKERDEESGLYYHGARYYATWLGRWISFDPEIFKANNFDHATYQPYVYVQNKPTIAIDPDGEAANFLASVVGAAVGAVVGGGIEAGRQLLTQKKVSNWGSVGASAAGGAVSGAAAGLTMGASLAVQATATTGAAVAGGATTRALTGQEQSAGAIIKDAVVGLVTFGVIKGGSSAIRSISGGGNAATKAAGSVNGAPTAKVIETPRPAAPVTPQPAFPSPGPRPVVPKTVEVPKAPVGVSAGELSIGKSSAPVVSPNPAVPSSASLPLYQIGEGVRRSVAARELGNPDVLAQVMGSKQPPIRIPLNQLLSPKASIPRDNRYIELFKQIGKDGQSTPIDVTPVATEGGGSLTPLLNVNLTKFRGF
jgi:RHS repeat-associated protein